MILVRTQIFAVAMLPSLLLSANAQDKATVLAKLGEQPITNRDVDFQLGRVTGESGQPLRALSPAVLQSAINLVAQQRQALQTLRTRKLALGREEVERWLEENSQPKNGERSAPAEIIREQARQAEIAESNLRDHWAFRLSWQRFVQQQLTEANVSKHFENQPLRFNGTRFKLSVADIAVPAGKSTRREKAADTLVSLRSRLQSGDLSWKDLAGELQKSEALQGQAERVRVREDLWARGTGDLEPTIVSALMQMEPSAYSEPIHTPTGVHLIKLIEVEVGHKELSEVRDEVRAHMLLHLLEHLARQSESQLPLTAVE
jgi:PPIC-type PPIASE domain